MREFNFPRISRRISSVTRFPMFKHLIEPVFEKRNKLKKPEEPRLLIKCCNIFTFCGAVQLCCVPIFHRDLLAGKVLIDILRKVGFSEINSDIIVNIFETLEVPIESYSFHFVVYFFFWLFFVIGANLNRDSGQPVPLCFTAAQYLAECPQLNLCLALSPIEKN